MSKPPARFLSPEQEKAMLEREKIVLQERIKGKSFYKIEKETGITNPDRVFRRAVERDENAGFRRAEAIRLEEMRLDELQEGIWDKAIGGDSRAVEVALKVLERRARMHGLDFADMVSGQLVEVEQAKVKIMAQALVTAMNAVDGLTKAQSDALTDAFFAHLRAAQDESGPQTAPVVVQSTVVQRRPPIEDPVLTPEDKDLL